MADQLIIVRSVLGDERTAAISAGAGYPWYCCPFCTYPVYVREASPEHSKDASAATHGRCNNPWCVANPSMPLDAARLARGQAMLQEQDERSRRRNVELANQRIDEEAALRQAAWQQRRAEAERQGACLVCARWHFNQGKPARLVHHRGPCPRMRR